MTPKRSVKKRYKKETSYFITCWVTQFPACASAEALSYSGALYIALKTQLMRTLQT